MQYVPASSSQNFTQVKNRDPYSVQCAGGKGGGGGGMKRDDHKTSRAITKPGQLAQ